MQVDVFTPNNVPVTNATIHVWKLNDHDRFDEEEIVTTDSRGGAVAIFQTPQKTRLSFRVKQNNIESIL